jgi:hypothetical protein
MADIFEARWIPPGTWEVRPPWGEWQRARGTWKRDKGLAAVHRTFGRRVKGARIVVVAEGTKTP